ncbi:MAG: GNAT family N-acetyltransferase [Muribaculaceae bacterium]|nr:GNAT family N-acetyltransferase [Muribaculaceae bacterium]
MLHDSIKQINNPEDSILGAVHNLYMKSFPETERRPWEGIIELLSQPNPFFNLYVSVNEDGVLQGFISTWRLPDSLYIEHFAIEVNLRSQGIGGAMLDYVKQKAGEKPVVVEVELPEDNPDAPRRIKFYEHHGFMAMKDFVYFQPPYAKGLPDVRLMLMTSKKLPDLQIFVITLHNLVYNQ